MIEITNVPIVDKCFSLNGQFIKNTAECPNVDFPSIFGFRDK
jgi:hypothetical protein